jgi:CO/xanthine dehydrogenase Mo-binding subunit
VFYESVGYGEGGALNVGSILEAGVAAAEDLPLDIESELYEYPSSYTHGSRGIGEAGTIGSLPCIVSAIEDAIGVRLRSAMLSPERLWAVVNDVLVRRGCSAKHRSIKQLDRDAISEVGR